MNPNLNHSVSLFGENVNCVAHLTSAVQSLYNTTHYNMDLDITSHVVAPNDFLPCNFTKVL